ncbi:MAG: tetratricopeptide repeat protein [Planctomycetales bacterium]
MWKTFWAGVLRRFVTVVSGDASMHHEVAELLENLDQWDHAIRHFGSAIELAPQQARHYSARSRAYFKSGDSENAMADSVAALALNPEDDLGWYIKGFCLEGLGRRKEAIESIEQAITLNPGDSTYREAFTELISRNKEGHAS